MDNHLGNGNSGGLGTSLSRTNLGNSLGEPFGNSLGNGVVGGVGSIEGVNFGDLNLFLGGGGGVDVETMALAGMEEFE